MKEEKEKLIMDALDEKNKAKRRRMISDKKKIEDGKAYRKRITGSHSYFAMLLFTHFIIPFFDLLELITSLQQVFA